MPPKSTFMPLKYNNNIDRLIPLSAPGDIWGRPAFVVRGAVPTPIGAAIH
jgi:hypothetical protein